MTGAPGAAWVSARPASSLGCGVVEQNLDRLHPGGPLVPEEGLRVTLDGYLAARRRRFGYVRELDELLGEDGVVFLPTIASQGWLAEGRLSTDDQVGALPGEVYNTSVQNTTGHPALSLPADSRTACRSGCRSLARGSATICCWTPPAPGRRPGSCPGRPGGRAVRCRPRPVAAEPPA